MCVFNHMVCLRFLPVYELHANIYASISDWGVSKRKQSDVLYLSVDGFIGTTSGLIAFHVFDVVFVFNGETQTLDLFRQAISARK